MSTAPHTSVLCYMTGAPDLDQALLADVAQLRAVPGVQLAIQVDLAGAPYTVRRYVPAPGPDAPEPSEERLATNVNAGDPEELLSFLDWARERAPAPRYVLVLWGHGTGPLDREEHETRSEPAGKAILIDATTRDAVTMGELASLAPRIRLRFGGSLELLIADACYMGAFEFATQVAGFCPTLVASEYVMPYEGIPYPRLLALLSEVDWSPERVATLVVEAFAQEHLEHPHVLAAFTLERLAAVEGELADLAEALVLCPRESVLAMRAGVQSMAVGRDASRDPRVDLGHLTHRVEQCLPGRPAAVARRLRAALLGARLAEHHGGAAFSAGPLEGAGERVSGLSVMFPHPATPVAGLPEYSRFQHPEWHRFLRHLLALPPQLRASAHLAGRGPGEPVPVACPGARLPLTCTVSNSAFAEEARDCQLLVDRTPRASLPWLDAGEDHHWDLELEVPEIDQAPVGWSRHVVHLRHAEGEQRVGELACLSCAPGSSLAIIWFDVRGAADDWTRAIPPASADLLRQSELVNVAPADLWSRWPRLVLVVQSVNLAPTREAWAYLEMRGRAGGEIAFVGADVAHLIDQLPADSRRFWYAHLGITAWREPHLSEAQYTLRQQDRAAEVPRGRLAYMDVLELAPGAEPLLTCELGVVASRQRQAGAVGLLWAIGPEALGAFADLAFSESAFLASGRKGTGPG